MASLPAEAPAVKHSADAPPRKPGLLELARPRQTVRPANEDEGIRASGVGDRTDCTVPYAHSENATCIRDSEGSFAERRARLDKSLRQSRTVRKLDLMQRNILQGVNVVRRGVRALEPQLLKRPTLSEMVASKKLPSDYTDKAFPADLAQSVAPLAERIEKVSLSRLLPSPGPAATAVGHGPCAGRGHPPMAAAVLPPAAGARPQSVAPGPCVGLPCPMGVASLHGVQQGALPHSHNPWVQPGAPLGIVQAVGGNGSIGATHCAPGPSNSSPLVAAPAHDKPASWPLGASLDPAMLATLVAQAMKSYPGACAVPHPKAQSLESTLAALSSGQQVPQRCGQAPALQAQRPPACSVPAPAAALLSALAGMHAVLPPPMPPGCTPQKPSVAAGASTSRSQESAGQQAVPSARHAAAEKSSSNAVGADDAHLRASSDRSKTAPSSGHTAHGSRKHPVKHKHLSAHSRTGQNRDHSIPFLRLLDDFCDKMIAETSCA